MPFLLSSELVIRSAFQCAFDGPGVLISLRCEPKLSRRARRCAIEACRIRGALRCELWVAEELYKSGMLRVYQAAADPRFA